MQRCDEPTGIEGESTDIALMLRVRQSGDTDAFALLVSRYRNPLKRFFAALLPAAPADDFAQETLLRLWISRGRYQPTGKFSAYLFQIARHYYLNQRERYRTRRSQEVSADLRPDVSLVDILPSPRTQPERVLLERLEQARVREAIESLPAHYRCVFVLCHFDGLKYAEIGERLGIPVGTVKSRMAEAARRLRRTLLEEGE